MGFLGLKYDLHHIELIPVDPITHPGTKITSRTAVFLSKLILMQKTTKQHYDIRYQAGPGWFILTVA